MYLVDNWLMFRRRLPLNFLHPPYTPENMEQAEYHKIEPEYLARLVCVFIVFVYALYSNLTNCNYRCDAFWKEYLLQREDSFIRENGDKQLDQFNDRLFIL